MIYTPSFVFVVDKFFVYSVQSFVHKNNVILPTEHKKLYQILHL